LRGKGHHDLPILMLSARTLPEDRIRGYEVGTDQYLQKPFELDELLAMVRNLLQRRNGRPKPPSIKEGGGIYEFGRAKVNFDTYEATVAGVPVQMTNMEMKLLRYFIENEGLVVSRSELLEHVWGMSSSPTTRTVDNFIVRMRKYFEVDPAEPQHFLSVRGAGYRFVAHGGRTSTAGESGMDQD
jgi:two-component system OmpR family response regulator